MTTVEPTIDVARAPAVAWDAIVIGAGPAGAFTALRLARSGARTLVVDRKSFPRHKVCGGCLSAQSVGVLRSAGLADALRASGARPLSTIQLRNGSRRADLPLPSGLAITRATFDALLVRSAIAAGCDFARATASLTEDEALVRPILRHVRLSQPDGEVVTAAAKIVIAADGLGHSSLRDAAAFSATVEPDARVGVGTVAGAGCIDAPAGAVTMAVGRGGYVGVVGVEGDRVNVAAALDPAFLKSHGSPARAVRNILASADIAAGAELDMLDWEGTIPLTRRLSSPVGHRLFVLGDAAGYVEPFTGEGMAWALSAADALEPLAMSALDDWNESVERRWIDTYDTIVRQRQRWCRIVARALRHPSLVRAVVASLSRWPALAGPLVARIAPAAAPAPVGGVR